MSDGLHEYELASEHDSAGRESEAVQHYEAALRLGLPDDVLPGALLGYGSTLRNVGRFEESVSVLDEACSRFPEDHGLKAFRALALHSAGRERAGLADALELALDSGEPTIVRYERALRGYIGELRSYPHADR